MQVLNAMSSLRNSNKDVKKDTAIGRQGESSAWWQRLTNRVVIPYRSEVSAPIGQLLCRLKDNLSYEDQALIE